MWTCAFIVMIVNPGLTRRAHIDFCRVATAQCRRL